MLAAPPRLRLTSEYDQAAASTTPAKYTYLPYHNTCLPWSSVQAMSFGVAVGDVIAVGELCWKLYRNVYQVSRHAPAELKALGNELNSLKGILDILKEEKINPDSAINQSGQGRLDLFNKVLSQTGETLNQIEELSNKYKILKRPRNAQSQRGYFKIQWDKLRYAKELHSINDLRAKV